jgi:hypothetical protein
MRGCMFPLMPAYGGRVRLALRLLVIGLVVVAVVGVEGISVALVLAPALLLALPLLFKRYLGERVIHRFTRRAPAARVARSAVLPRAPRLLGARVAALAVPGSGRAPPAVA